jgi:hypothetical protein
MNNYNNNNNNKDIVDRMEISIIITVILLMITAAAAELPRSSHAISINHIKLKSGYEQYNIIKQVADDNAFSNLSRSLSPPAGAGNVTSNSTNLITPDPGNSGGNSSTTSTSAGSISPHHGASVNQPHHHSSVSLSHSTNSTQ